MIGVGAAVGSIRDVRRSFLEASQVADVAAERPDGWGARRGSGRPPFYRLADLRLRGLLHLLRDDPRVQTFVERELGPLLAEPDASLLDVLAAFLGAGGNKAEAAKHAHLAAADVLRTAAADRAHPRYRPGFGRIAHVAARGAAGPGGGPGRARPSGADSGVCLASPVI